MGISLLLIEITIVAGLGSFAYELLARRGGLHTIHILEINLAFMLIVPVWGCVGFVSAELGL